MTRRILAGLLWFLACVAILFGSVALWANRTLLTADGWTGVVSQVVADPEVIDNASERIVDRLSTALDLENRIAGLLPGEGTIIATAVTGALEDRMTGLVANVASDERVQQAFVNVNRAAHEAALRVIQEDPDGALTNEEGVIAVNVFPLVSGALTALQEAGLIDESREIPDLTGYEPPPETIARLEGILGRDLPDDLGTITLVESDRLANVQQVVRTFNVITVLAILAAVVFVALAIALSARRLLMIVWLALGAIVALMLGRMLTRLLLEEVTGSLRGADGAVAVRAVIESAADSLMWFTFAVIVTAVVVAAVAAWLQRRDDPGTTGSAPGLVASAESPRAWLQARSWLIAAIGIGIVLFVVLWNVAGPDTTMLAGGLIGLILIVVAFIGGFEKPSSPGESAGGSAGSV